MSLKTSNWIVLPLLPYRTAYMCFYFCLRRQHGRKLLLDIQLFSVCKNLERFSNRWFDKTEKNIDEFTNH